MTDDLRLALVGWTDRALNVVILALFVWLGYVMGERRSRETARALDAFTTFVSDARCVWLTTPGRPTR